MSKCVTKRAKYDIPRFKAKQTSIKGKRRWIPENIISYVATLCCSLQTIYILVQYWKYSTVTNLKIGESSRETPNLTLTMDPKHLIASSRFQKYIRDRGLTTDDIYQSIPEGNYTHMASFLRENSHTMFDIGVKEYGRGWFGPANTTIMMSKYNIAIVSSASRSLIIEPRYRINLKAFMSTINYTVEVCLLLHSEFLSDHATDDCVPLLLEPQQHIFHYHAERVELLPPPYVTNCRRNFPFGANSRDSCETACLRNKSLSDCDSVVDYIPSLASQTEVYLRKSWSTKCYVDNNMYGFCNEKCMGVLCDGVSYHLYFSYDDIECQYCIDIMPSPHYPNFTFKSFPKLYLIDLIVYIGSTAAIWLGFSTFGWLRRCLQPLMKTKPSTSKLVLVLPDGKRIVTTSMHFYKTRFKHSSKFSLRNPSKALITNITLVLIVGLLFGILCEAIISQYFRRETIVKISLKTSGSMPLPGLLVGFDLRTTLNLTKFCVKHSNYCAKDNGTFIDSDGFLVEPLTYNEIQINTLDADYLFPECQVYLKGHNDRVNCTSVAEPKVGVGFRMVYYYFFSDGHWEYDWSTPSRYFIQLRLASHLNKVKHKALSVSVNDGTLENTLYSQADTIIGDNNYILGARSITLRRLPPPFPTNCLRYPTIGYQSRQDCAAKCLISGMHEKCRFLPKRFIYFDSLDKRGFQRLCAQRFFNLLLKQCSKKCSKPDCFKQLYKDVDVNLKPSDFPQILFRLPTDSPPILYEYQARLSSLDLFVYLAGIVGICFGISIYNLATRILNFANLMRTALLLYLARRRAMMLSTRNSVSPKKIWLSLDIKKLSISMLYILVAMGTIVHASHVLGSYFGRAIFVQQTFHLEDASLPMLTLTHKDLNVDILKASVSDCSLTNLVSDIVVPCDYQTVFYDSRYVTLHTKNTTIKTFFLWTNINISDFDVMLHSSYTTPDINVLKSVHLTIKQYMMVLLKYTKFVVKKLPSPYETHCKFLTREEEESQNCLSECIKQSMASSERQSRRRTYQACYDYCERQNCYAEYYFVKVVKSSKAVKGDEMLLQLERPFSPVLYYEFKVRMSTMDLIVYLANVFSLWIGISFVSLPVKLKKSQKKAFFSKELKF